MHINLKQKKIYYNIDIHKSKLFESQNLSINVCTGAKMILLICKGIVKVG